MVLAGSSATGRAELHSVNKPGHQSEFCHLTNVCLWVSSSVKLKITTVHRTPRKVISKRHCSCHFLFRTRALAILKGICKISGWRSQFFVFVCLPSSCQRSGLDHLYGAQHLKLCHSFSDFALHRWFNSHKDCPQKTFPKSPSLHSDIFWVSEILRYQTENPPLHTYTFTYNLKHLCCCSLVTEVVSDSCNPMDGSSPGSSVHGILQARILEWVAISFSRGSS